jgi:hypothetical protein
MPLTPADASGQPRTLVALSVMPDGQTVIPAKSVKVSDGFGGWRLAWVAPVKAATLSFSKSPVLVGEAFNVIASVPAGTPEGAYAMFRSTEGHNYRVDFPTGSTTVTLVGHSHAPTGAHDWYVDFYTMGGTTTFGPARQTAVARSTASVSGPSWFMSHRCPNPSGLNYIPDVTFSISLSNYTAATRVELQIASWSDGVFKTIGIWTPAGVDDYADIPGASWTWTFANSLFDRDGMWSARIILTFADGATYESPHYGMDVRVKGLGVQSDHYSPVVNTVVTLSAFCNYGDCGIMYSAAQWFHNGGSGWNPDSGSNPVQWAAWGTISWLWREVFADGSVLHSNVITVAPVAAPTEVVTDNGSYNGVSGGTGLVNAMRAARSAGLPLRVVGTWTLELNDIWIPDGVTVRAHGAVFNHRPVARFKNAAKWPAANMPDSCRGYDGGTFHWEGGEFNGGGDGIFTISHSPGFTIRDTTMYNYCTSTEDGHAIEINSSGGNDLGLADYRVWIVNNKFRGVQNGQRPNSNDEPVHYDWAWKGSGCGGAEDHTMCHNVYIGSNEFWSPWEHAKCAIGGHRMSSASYNVMGNAGLANPADGNPSERHNSFLIEGNVIHGATGATSGVSPDKGSIALFCLRGVHVRNNAFYGCLPGVSGKLVSAFDPTQNLNSAIVGISIYGNTHDGAAVNISMPASGSTGG